MDSMITVVCVQGTDTTRARQLAQRLGIGLSETVPEEKDARYLIVEQDGITFVAGDRRLRGDFSRLLPRVTGGKLQHELLLKAAKHGRETELHAVDATAGMGEDAFILAAAGYRVELCEHNPLTFVLLEDALVRAENDERLRSIISRMTLHAVDSKEYLREIGFRPNLVYLDPMFPEKKKSAESKNKLQVLHRIEEPCTDEQELLSVALGAKPGKIIIKRPPGCAYLGGIKPTYSIERKAVRFDCIVPFGL